MKAADSFVETRVQWTKHTSLACKTLRITRGSLPTDSSICIRQLFMCLRVDSVPHTHVAPTSLELCVHVQRECLMFLSLLSIFRLGVHFSAGHLTTKPLAFLRPSSLSHRLLVRLEVTILHIHLILRLMRKSSLQQSSLLNVSSLLTHFQLPVKQEKKARRPP